MIERVFRGFVARLRRMKVASWSSLSINGDGAFLLRVADGIHQEVQHHLLHPAIIGHDRQLLGGADDDVEIFFLQGIDQFIRSFIDQVTQ